MSTGDESPAPRHTRAVEDDAFRELVDPYRRELHVHCYRLLGSVQDAEDVLQETLLAAWRARESFDGRAPRAWLYRIATNRCRNHLRDASRRPKAATVTTSSSPFDQAARTDEPWWLEPYPDTLLDQPDTNPQARYDARESIALSFVAGLQRLPVQQRCAVVLRDVLGYSAGEVADMLDSTPASVNSALQRARAALPHARTAEEVVLPRATAANQLIDRFVEAFQRGDIDAVVALLSDDATVTMPPEPFAFHGPAAIAAFYRAQNLWHQRVLLVPTSANGQPAFGYYLPDQQTGLHRAAGLLVLTVTADHITGITRFGDRGVLTRFGLPRTL